MEGCCDVKMKEEFEQTVCLGGKLCNKVSKEIICSCSCFCEVNLAEGISGTPPLSENLAIHTHIYIYKYIRIYT